MKINIVDDQSRVNKADRLLLVVLAASLIANVLLAVILLRTRNGIVAYTQQHLGAHILPSQGIQINELHLVEVSGGKLDLKFGAKELPVVIYVFSPTCRWCNANKTNVDSLVAQIHGKYRFIGVLSNPQDVGKYVKQQDPPFPVYYLDPDFPNYSIPLAVTPRTLVFSSAGSLLRGWDGAYMGETKMQLLSFFGVKLAN
jgi:hypothetical protein